MKFSQIKLLGLVLLLAGLILACFGLSLLFGPPQFQATARIKTELDFYDTLTVPIPPDPDIIQTIQSDVVLSEVVKALNLETAWGNRFSGGRKLSAAEAIAFLKKHLAVASIRNTKIFAIKVRDEDPIEAAKIANAIGDAYGNYRREIYSIQITHDLAALQRQYDDQTHQIQVMQTNVDNLRQALHISIQQMATTLPEERVLDLNRQLMEDTRDYNLLLGEVNQLKTYNKIKLRGVMPSIIEDRELSELLNKLHEARQEKTMLGGSDYNNPTNPIIIRLQSSIDTLNRQIDDRVAGAMAGFDAKVKVKKDAIDAMHETLKEAKAKDLAKTLQYQPYYDAKLKLDELMDQHRLFYAKMESDRIDAQIPKSLFVQIIDWAKPPTYPIGPNRPLGAVMLAIGLITAFGGLSLLLSKGKTTE